MMADRCQLLFDELYRLMMPELLLIKPFSYERELKISYLFV